MNNEIKEIQYELNILSNTILDDTTYCPTIKRRKILLDYITNLQEEKENQAHTIKTLLKGNVDVSNRNKKGDDR